MVYIPFPREDKNRHDDLVAWRLIANKRESDWKSLKLFLAEQPRLVQGIHPVPKCWYSELPQGDNYTLDVEHFRPKNQASPLTEDQLKVLEKEMGFKFRQAAIQGRYPWLAFDYRNYRLVTATPNRSGAKYVYFPIAENSVRLNEGTFPWASAEYPYFLDPANPYDASLLLVLPNGKIIPRTDKTELTDADFDNLAQHWQSDKFNYIRAAVTIQLYRLNDRIFQEGRKEVYDYVNEIMSRLQDCFPVENDRYKRLRDGFIRDLTVAALPSAPFALAARCALEAYTPPIDISNNLQQALAPIPRQILDKIHEQVRLQVTSWENE
jgi:hypothetical protein